MKPLILLLWTLALLSVGAYLLLRPDRAATPAGVQVILPPEAQQASDGELPVYFKVPGFAFTDHDGQAFSSEALRGKVWIGFIFLTHCPTGACPVMVSKMASLQEALPDPRIHFVSFSVDPERDTPEALREYVTSVGGEISDRWHLLTGDSRQGMASFAREMKLIVDEDFGHSTVFLLVDAEGNVRGSFGNEDPDGMARLREAAGKLLEQPQMNTDAHR